VCGAPSEWDDRGSDLAEVPSGWATPAFVGDPRTVGGASLIVAARGALNSLMTEVIEDHIQAHVVERAKDAEQSRGAEELIEAVQAYLK
jgi:Metal-sensitive transcriptional repressor